MGLTGVVPGAQEHSCMGGGAEARRQGRGRGRGQVQEVGRGQEQEGEEKVCHAGWVGGDWGGRWG